MFSRYLVIFLLSLVCVSLELFLTRVLNLKAWNHVVYTVIPFAMLGFGIGANFVLVFNNYFRKFKTNTLLGFLLFLSGLFTLSTSLLLKDLPIRVDYIVSIFSSLESIAMLLLAYTIFMVPFTLIGFTIVYLFTNNPHEGHKLYFFDLLGAGLGAYLFFPLINNFDVYHSLAILSFACVLTAIWISSPKIKWVLLSGTIIVFFMGFYTFKEPIDYSVDPRKGWEWIPGYFEKNNYDYVSSRWHPLGRTDVFRMKDKNDRDKMSIEATGTFNINVDPQPEFSYFSTNFLGGTPVFNLSPQAMAQNNSQIKLFSQRMEVPYTLLDKPKVLIIGAGGGRDIFMAHTHGAKQIWGAEINPAIVREMSPGGSRYEYSGRIYTSENTKVYAIDGRHLVKSMPEKSVDLIVLNGVDTFSGLSSGAYAYAESYLYTRNAVEDYLRTLTDDGILNIYRWSFPAKPREELRLYAIALAALKSRGVTNPLDHIIVGVGDWSVFLIKKTPFSPQQRAIVTKYFKEHDILMLAPAEERVLKSTSPLLAFNDYIEAFKNNTLKAFEDAYPFDVSVITDDSPFFYKYYKLKDFNPRDVIVVHHLGTIIFMTQALIFLQALIFIILFIALPLHFFKNQEIKRMPPKSVDPFIIFFACLGTGFMFIEIPLMQKFVLILGSPIYSISVVLAVLLAATGIGSLLIYPLFEKIKQTKSKSLGVIVLILTLYLFGLMAAGTAINDLLMPFSFLLRIVCVSLIILPLGLLLGVFFPLGLGLIQADHKEALPWAWGINCGFSVLGSILAIIIAQFSGFNFVILLACLIYFCAWLAFARLSFHFKQ